MRITFTTIYIFILLTSCNSNVESAEETAEPIDSTYCICSDLIFDEAYNHFYRFKRREGFSGLCEEFYPSGNKKISKHFFDGKLTGQMFIWFENGDINEQLEFDTNFQTGEHLIFAKTGDTLFYALYKRGKLLEVFIDQTK